MVRWRRRVRARDLRADLPSKRRRADARDVRDRRGLVPLPGVPAAGARIEVTGLDVFRFAEGRVVETPARGEPRSHGTTRETMAYDAGSERNNELESHIPGPCCGSPFVRDPEGALIAPHEGITGRGQLDPASYDWHGAAARITVERVS